MARLRTMEPADVSCCRDGEHCKEISTDRPASRDRWIDGEKPLPGLISHDAQLDYFRIATMRELADLGQPGVSSGQD